MSERAAVRVLAYMASQPWAMTGVGLDRMLAIAERLEPEISIEALEARLGKPLANDTSATVRDGIALIPVTGPLFRYADMFTRISGATSFDGLAKDFTAALDNPAVQAIVLDINSPGGEVDGTLEMAAMIHAARGTKPILSYISNQGASAAYWIAAAADQVIASPTALIGSVGAVIPMDVRAPREGTKSYTFVSAQSPKKRMDVATPEGQAEIQKLTDDLGQVFVEHVAKYRGVTPDKVMADYGKGAVLVGAAAVDAGLADRLATYEQVHAELLANAASGTLVRSRAGMAGTISPEGAMPEDTKHPARLTRAQLETEYAAEIGAIRSEVEAKAKAEGVEAGAAAERTRITAIRALEKPGREKLIGEAIADPKAVAGDVALKIEALNTARAKGKLAAQEEDEAKLDAPADTGAPTEEAGDPKVKATALMQLFDRATGQKPRVPAGRN